MRERIRNIDKTKIWLCTTLLLSMAFFALSSTPAMAAGPNAIITPSGYNTNILARSNNDVGTAVTLPFPITWKNATNVNQGYVNMNGYFKIGNTVYNNNIPNAPLNSSFRQDVLMPFWADVDTTNPLSGQVSYSNLITPPVVNGRNAFIITWDRVGYYNAMGDKLNSFQLVILDRSDTGAGNFDFWFNYDVIQWDRSTNYTTNAARVGYAVRSPATGYEIPESGATSGSPLIDGGSNALVNGTLNANGQLGRYIFLVRAGVVTSPNFAPIITIASPTVTLEGNTGGATPGYTGYSGAGDATATDPDGTIASLVRSPAAGTFLPLGMNTITWTATDNLGLVTTKTQTINVVDTTAPTLPTVVSSSTHSVNVWSKIMNIIINWSNDVVDACSGFNGYSFNWSQNTAATPPSTINGAPNVTSNSNSLTDGRWYFNIRTVDKSNNWSVAKSSGPYLIDTLPPVNVDNIPSSWTNGNFSLTLNCTDAGSGIKSIKYTLDGSGVLDYTTPVAIGTDGLHPITYYAIDNVDNSSALITKTLQLDRGNPTIPANLVANPTSLSTVDITWSGSTDLTSGLKQYNLYRDGVLIATLPNTTTSYTDLGLSSGTSYTYFVTATDNANNTSNNSNSSTANIPATVFSMTLSSNNVDMGDVLPNLPKTVPSAVTASIRGVGNLNYDFSCSASNFANANPLSPTPSISANALSYLTTGKISLADRAFSTSNTLINHSGSTTGVWTHNYTFDYTMNISDAYEPGVYSTTVVYTVVLN